MRPPLVPAAGAPGSLAPTPTTLIPEAPHVLSRCGRDGFETTCPSCGAGLVLPMTTAVRTMHLRFAAGCACGARFNVEVPLTTFSWARVATTRDAQCVQREGKWWCPLHGGPPRVTLDSWPPYCADCYYKILGFPAPRFAVSARAR